MNRLRRFRRGGAKRRVRKMSRRKMSRRKKGGNIPTILKKGPLYKKGAGERYFKLYTLLNNGAVLKYGPPGCDNGMEGKCDLGGISNISEVTEKDGNKFMVAGDGWKDGNKFVLRADTSHGKHEWVDAIRDAIAGAERQRQRQLKREAKRAQQEEEEEEEEDVQQPPPAPPPQQQREEDIDGYDVDYHKDH